MPRKTFRAAIICRLVQGGRGRGSSSSLDKYGYEEVGDVEEDTRRESIVFLFLNISLASFCSEMRIEGGRHTRETHTSVASQGGTQAGDADTTTGSGCGILKPEVRRAVDGSLKKTMTGKRKERV